MHTMKTHAGQQISDACRDALALANRRNEPIAFEFNGQTLTMQPGGNVDALVTAFHEEQERRSAAYRQSPEYAAEERRRRDKEARRAAKRDRALAVAPEALTLRDPDKWQSWVTANTDPYGAACVTYAARWARLMEGAMTQGQTVAQCADEMSHLADDEGITGFMYGCAVSMLAGAWIHGEELRRWHNLKTQVGTEGEHANENGGVLNPALLNIDSGERK